MNPSSTEAAGPSPEEKRRLEIIDLAREQIDSALKYAADKPVEVDDNAQLSEGEDNGCWVQAWVWVDFSETKFDKDKELAEAQRQEQRTADRIDGYDRDDLGESPDF